jgi:hypothetical protein
MSNFEVTKDDVETVLERHELSLNDEQVEEIHDGLDFERIDEVVFEWNDLDSQTASMFSEIEDQMIEDGIITGEKKFFDLDGY